MDHEGWEMPGRAAESPQVEELRNREAEEAPIAMTRKVNVIEFVKSRQGKETHWWIDEETKGTRDPM